MSYISFENMDKLQNAYRLMPCKSSEIRKNRDRAWTPIPHPPPSGRLRRGSDQFGGTKKGRGVKIRIKSIV